MNSKITLAELEDEVGYLESSNPQRGALLARGLTKVKEGLAILAQLGYAFEAAPISLPSPRLPSPPPGGISEQALGAAVPAPTENLQVVGNPKSEPAAVLGGPLPCLVPENEPAPGAAGPFSDAGGAEEEVSPGEPSTTAQPKPVEPPAKPSATI